MSRDSLTPFAHRAVTAVGAGCVANPSSQPEFVMFVSSALMVILKTSEGFGGLKWVFLSLTPGIAHCERSKGSRLLGRTSIYHFLAKTSKNYVVLSTANGPVKGGEVLLNY